MGDQTQGLMVARQALPLNYIPSPNPVIGFPLSTYLSGFLYEHSCALAFSRSCDFFLKFFPLAASVWEKREAWGGKPAQFLGRRAFYRITIQWINPQLIYTQHSTSVCSLFCAFLLPCVWEMQHKNKPRSGITYWESTQRHVCKWKRPPCQGATTAPQESFLGLLQGSFLHLCSSGHRSSRVHLLRLPLGLEQLFISNELQCKG